MPAAPGEAGGGAALSTTTELEVPRGGPSWLVDRRLQGAALVATLAPPSPTEELWRYSPIAERSLVDLVAAKPGDVPAGVVDAVLAKIDAIPAAVAVTVDGALVTLERTGLAAAVRFGSAESSGEILTAARDEDQSLALHDATALDLIELEVPRGLAIDGPVVVIHLISDQPEARSAPWVAVHLGEGASADLIEVIIGGGRTSVTLSATEAQIDAGARLRHVALQDLNPGAWSIIRQQVAVGRDATLESCSVSLGGAYSRTRTDVAVGGSGATSRVRSIYLGTEDQVHDVRTIQDHLVGHTTSDLLCTGAVAGSSRSIFTGTIRIRHGARRSDAVQRNHNLVLGAHAQAESVPNLDILENDVSCAHGSTVGPVDEDQRYYLESRGIEPVEAERLLVRGFFTDVLSKLPLTAAAPLVAEALDRRLSSALEEVGRDA